MSEFVNTSILLCKGINSASVRIHELSRLSKEERPDVLEILNIERQVDERVFGFYALENEDLIRERIKENAQDIHETNYIYIVLEKVWSGIYPYTEVICWYKWNPETEKYDEIERPEWSKNICNWTLG